MPLNKPRHGSANGNLGRIGTRADAQEPGVQPKQQADFPLCFLGLMQQLARSPEQQPTDRGGFRATATSIQEPRPELTLERLYATGECGLGQPERLGGLCVISMPGHLDEVAELTKVEGHADNVSKNNVMRIGRIDVRPLGYSWKLRMSDVPSGIEEGVLKCVGAYIPGPCWPL